MSPTSYLTAPPRVVGIIYSTALRFVKPTTPVLPWAGMETFLTILATASAFLAFVSGVSALRAGLRLRRTYLALRSYLYAEVVQLAGRATELEKSLTALDARARALPVHISELQQNLAALRVLTNALGISLGQAQRALSSTGIKSSLARPHSRTFEARAGRVGASNVDERDEIRRP